ncbi:hypothetical protein MSG28_008346 [Choristoneura fumiferana]|uniref:Uncharacterized protein n=1 Tax=Choristoneura fumiferana TaxID=7141 RepID=A0ACC0JB30_CHOFU|nr:hypothetical protein MSG28_008346 [Choristoneura fumiferana]
MLAALLVAAATATPRRSKHYKRDAAEDAPPRRTAPPRPGPPAATGPPPPRPATERPRPGPRLATARQHQGHQAVMGPQLHHLATAHQHQGLRAATELQLLHLATALLLRRRATVHPPPHQATAPPPRDPHPAMEHPQDRQRLATAYPLDPLLLTVLRPLNLQAVMERPLPDPLAATVLPLHQARTVLQPHQAPMVPLPRLPRAPTALPRQALTALPPRLLLAPTAHLPPLRHPRTAPHPADTVAAAAAASVVAPLAVAADLAVVAGSAAAVDSVAAPPRPATARHRHPQAATEHQHPLLQAAMEHLAREDSLVAFRQAVTLAAVDSRPVAAPEATLQVDQGVTLREAREATARVVQVAMEVALARVVSAVAPAATAQAVAREATAPVDRVVTAAAPAGIPAAFRPPSARATTPTAATPTRLKNIDEHQSVQGVYINSGTA